MDKSKTKNKKYTYDVKILDALVVKYGMTKVYMRKCLRGDYVSLTADKVKSDYASLQKEMNEALKNFNLKN